MAWSAAAASLVLGLAACSHNHASSSAVGPGSPTGATTTTAAPATTASPPTTRAVGPPDGPVPTGFQPSSVTFVSADQGWAIGDAPCANPVCTSIVRTRDGGLTWHGVPAPPAPFDATAGRLGSATGVWGLRFADPRDGWAFGGELWSTHDGGSTWSRQSAPGLGATDTVAALETTPAGVLAVIAPADGSTGSGEIDRSPTGADSWVEASTVPAPVSGAELVVGGHRVWVVPDATAAAGPAWLTASEAAGGVFLAGRGPCPAPASGGQVAAGPGNQLAVVCAGPGGAGQESKSVYTSADAGVTFSEPSSAPLGGDLEEAAAGGSTIVVAAASGASELYASFDGGRTWSTVFSEASGGIPFEEIGFTTASQGLAVIGVPTPAGAPVPGVPPSRLLMTRDSGRTWTVVRFGA
jgi:photosystem II stability/assembly factor-like uncharacterized protein